MSSSEHSAAPGRHEIKKYWNRGATKRPLQVAGCSVAGTITVCSVVSTEYKSSERCVPSPRIAAR